MPQNVYRYKNSNDLTDNTITNGKFECIFRTVEIYVIAVDISVDDGRKKLLHKTAFRLLVSVQFLFLLMQRKAIEFTERK